MSPAEPHEDTASIPSREDRERIAERVNDLYPSLFHLYTQLHANPELSGQEILTARRIADELRSAGYQVTEGVGGHGVVAVLANGTGPTVLLRADLDGLPIEEKTGLPYASKARGRLADKGDVAVMHACGHDIHMTALVGAAHILAATRKQWQGTLVLVGQPLEEVGAGARAMLEDGLFTKFPRPDYALALHVTPSLAAGTVGLREGLFWAGCASLDIVIRGIGGHGSRPHETKDPIVLAAETILLLQTIVSREISPLEPAVLTVGSIHGGTKSNIIPEEVVLQVNYRYFTDATARRLREAIERTVRGIAMAAGIPEDRLPILFDQYTGPPINNDPELARRMFSAFGSALGTENVIHTEKYTFSDDFSQFGNQQPKIPLCYFLLGTAEKPKDDKDIATATAPPGIHNPCFAPAPEPSIQTGVRALVAAVLEILPR
ncbi:MAG: amidohydrolase [Geobacteraceae bacterium]|nr:amidohydrolase [Geobacteraceae bacterium]